MTYRTANRDPHRYDEYTQADWHRLSKHYLADYPYCARCAQRKKRTLATECDHVIPVRHTGKLLDRSNLQGLCTKCHHVKTAYETHGKFYDYRSIPIRCFTKSV